MANQESEPQGVDPEPVDLRFSKQSQGSEDRVARQIVQPGRDFDPEALIKWRKVAIARHRTDSDGKIALANSGTIVPRAFANPSGEALELVRIHRRTQKSGGK